MRQRQFLGKEDNLSGERCLPEMTRRVRKPLRQVHGETNPAARIQEKSAYQ